MTRINPIFTRVYVNGYDLSGSFNNVGTVGVEHQDDGGTAYSDGVKNYTIGRADIKAGPINAYLSPSSSTDIHELLNAGNVEIDLMVGFGSDSVPVAGDPMFAWKMKQKSYKGESSGTVGVTIDISGASPNSPKTYDKPFGNIVHAKGTETAANTAAGIDDNGASSALGGIFVYQLFSSDGTVTLSLEEASTNTNANFAALTGATSGSIDATTTPKSGMVALATTATVKRYIRWQLAFDTASTATFALGFIRGS